MPRSGAQGSGTSSHIRGEGGSRPGGPSWRLQQAPGSQLESRGDDRARGVQVSFHYLAEMLNAFLQTYSHLSRLRPLLTQNFFLFIALRFSLAFSAREEGTAVPKDNKVQLQYTVYQNFSVQIASGSQVPLTTEWRMSGKSQVILWDQAAAGKGKRQLYSLKYTPWGEGVCPEQ